MEKTLSFSHHLPHSTPLVLYCSPARKPLVTNMNIAADKSADMAADMAFFPVPKLHGASSLRGPRRGPK